MLALVLIMTIGSKIIRQFYLLKLHQLADCQFRAYKGKVTAIAIFGKDDVLRVSPSSDGF